VSHLSESTERGLGGEKDKDRFRIAVPETPVASDQTVLFAAFIRDLVGNDSLLDVLTAEGTAAAMVAEGNKRGAKLLREDLGPVLKRGTKPVRQDLERRLRSPQALFCGLDLELVSRVDDGPSSQHSFASSTTPAAFTVAKALQVV
jgi:hypothetical protein